MAMLQKVANRIQARRRGGTEPGRPSQSSGSFSDSVHFSTSASSRNKDSQEFCVVDESMTHNKESVGDTAVSVPRSEDTEDTEDLEQMTEDLFKEFDYEADIEEPRHKALKQEERKPWEMGSKDLYEQQLMLMQEQLESTMIEKQALESEVKKYKQSEKEVKELREKVRELSGQLKGDPRRSSSEGASVDGGSRSYAGGNLHVAVSEEGYQEVTLSPSEDDGSKRSTQRKPLLQAAKDWVYDFLADFTEESSSPHEPPEEPPPLTYKKLKANLQRLLHSSKQWRDTTQHAQDVLHWKHVAESLVIFLLYMYCVWNGWVITVVLLIAIVKLGINYLHASGLAEQFGFPYPYTPQPPVEVPGLANKLQLVRKVAQTCQNLSGQASDALEKTQNLLLWHQPEATQRLFTVLCVGFVCSLFLSNSYMLTLVGLFAGFKLFIVDNVYRKYPKVQERYDTVRRIWKSLPTDAELYLRQSLTEEELQLSQSQESISSTRSDGSSGSGLAQSSDSFSQRFNIAPGEQPLPAWVTGKRCSFMNRDKPLSLTRSGKLYLTRNYLCFERMSHALRDGARVSIPLSDVMLVKKAKPFAVLPGSGMSIELTCSNGKKYMFSAILGRDQVYQNILDHGMILGLSWGSDITTETRRSGSSPRGSSSREGSSSSSEQASNSASMAKEFKSL